MNLVLLSTCAIVVAMLPTVVAAQSPEKTMITLGTATPGGGFPVYGEAVTGVINETDPGLEVRPRNTKGSTENVPLLEAGELDIALVQGEVAMEVLHGIGRAPSTLRIISAMYATAGMFVVRADSSYRTLEDLKGKPVAFGAKGSGLVLLARYILDGMGLDQNRDFEAIYLDRAGDGPAMVLDGRAQALWGGGIGWPGFTAVAKGSAGARFIVPNANDIARIRAKHSFLQILEVPANSFPGQNEVLTSVGSWSFILARPTLPDDVAYRLARALHVGEAALGQRLAQARETTSANTAQAAKRELLHPGVLKYLNEIGLVR
jgi:uncharacterized protein